jgi:hypothetical protein
MFIKYTVKPITDKRLHVIAIAIAVVIYPLTKRKEKAEGSALAA